MEVANNEVIKSGIVAKEKRFGIAASAKAFEILSSGLYSDKVKSVIRELSCNALDSHVMVGKGDVPFEVHLPSFVEPYFKITDFGLGIKEEDIYEVYTVYFASTKTQSNDQIGCHGLGSKSFFAYLNKGNAVVESTFNGEIKTYSAFIDEQGEPSIVLMNVEKTDNPNGLSVQFPVKTCDIDNFRNKAAEVYKYFKVKPIIKGQLLEFPEQAIILKGDGFTLREQDYDGCNAIMGNVCYPLDDLNDTTLTEIEKDLLKLPIDIEFAIGDLGVAVSREKLGYTAITVSNIKNKLNNILESIKDSVTNNIKNAKSLWEARILFNQYSSILSLRVNLIKALNIKYNDVLLTHGSISFDTLRYEGCFDVTDTYRQNRLKEPNFQITWYQLKNNKLKKNSEHSFYPNRTIKFLVNDLGDVNISNRIKNYLVSNGKNSITLYVLTFKDVAYIDKLKEFLGIDFDFVKVSSIPFVKNTYTKSDDGTATPVDRNFKYSVKEFVYNFKEEDKPSDNWDSTEVDIDNGGICVALDAFKIDGSKPQHYFNYYFKVLKRLGVDCTKLKIYGFKKSSPNCHKISSNEKWVSFMTYFNNQLTKYIDSDSNFKKWISYKLLKDDNYGKPATKLFDNVDDIIKHYENDDLKFLRTINKNNKNYNDLYTEIKNLIDNTIKNIYLQSDDMKDVVARIDNINNKYKLISHISWWGDSAFYADIAEYLKMVDSNFEKK